MKILTNVLSKLALVVVVFTVAASFPVKAQEVITNSTKAASTASARLIVVRAADFGTPDSINLFVDGSKIAVIGYNETYDGALSAGRHLLSISTNPQSVPEGTPEQLAITVEPGKTYVFTAVWPDPERAALVLN